MHARNPGTTSGAHTLAAPRHHPGGAPRHARAIVAQTAGAMGGRALGRRGAALVLHGQRRDREGSRAGAAVTRLAGVDAAVGRATTVPAARRVEGCFEPRPVARRARSRADRHRRRQPAGTRRRVALAGPAAHRRVEIGVLLVAEHRRAVRARGCLGRRGRSRRDPESSSRRAVRGCTGPRRCLLDRPRTRPPRPCPRSPRRTSYASSSCCSTSRRRRTACPTGRSHPGSRSPAERGTPSWPGRRSRGVPSHNPPQDPRASAPMAIPIPAALASRSASGSRVARLSFDMFPMLACVDAQGPSGYALEQDHPRRPQAEREARGPRLDRAQGKAHGIDGRHGVGLKAKGSRGLRTALRCPGAGQRPRTGN